MNNEGKSEAVSLMIWITIVTSFVVVAPLL